MSETPNWGRPVEDYFWKRVSPEPNSGCWLWTGSYMSFGYGMFGLKGLKNRSAHRWSYEHHKGPIPAGLVLDHLCRIPCCVNPDHLEAVTQRTNIMRADTGPTRNAAKLRCDYGHDFSPENTYVSPKEGERRCVKCDRRRRSARTARDKAKRAS